MANPRNKYGKKPVLNFIMDPRNKTRTANTLMANADRLSAAKSENLFRYTLRVEIYAARDKYDWEFLKHQMGILEKMLHEKCPSPQIPRITLIFAEHDTASADLDCPWSDIPGWTNMNGYLQRHEARGGICYQVSQASFEPWAGDFVEFGMQFER